MFWAIVRSALVDPGCQGKAPQQTAAGQQLLAAVVLDCSATANRRLDVFTPGHARAEQASLPAVSGTGQEGRPGGAPAGGGAA